MDEVVAQGPARRLRPGGDWDPREPSGRSALQRALSARDADAIDAAWVAWLAWPDDELRENLMRQYRTARWQDSGGWALRHLDTRPQDRAYLMAEAAARAGDLAAIVREQILAEAGDQDLVDQVCFTAAGGAGVPELAAWCAGHGLTPSDPLRRAAFYVLTGQFSQLRAADPDGSVLVLAYQAATNQERERLRAAMAGAGALDLVRVIAGGSGVRARQVTPDESGYLVRHLAAQEDWDGLWQLVRDLPLADAVAAMQEFPGTWRPPGETGRVLFARLAGADPEKIARAREGIQPPVPWSTDDTAVTRCSMSPDGRQLALPSEAGLDIVDLPGGGLAGRYRPDSGGYGILHLGEVVVVWGYDTVVRCAAGAAEQLSLSPAGPGARAGRILVTDVAPVPGGFAAHLQPYPNQSDLTRDDLSGWLRFWTTAGQVICDVPLAGLGLQRPVLVASEPGRGWLAFGCEDFDGLWIVDGDPAHDPRVAGAADSYADCIVAGCFAGPDRLITCTAWNGGASAQAIGVQLWDTSGGVPELRVSKDIKSMSPASVPDLGVVAVASPETGAVRLLDIESLDPLTELNGLTVRLDWHWGHHERRLWGARSGSYLAVARGEGVNPVDGRKGFAVVDVAPVVLTFRPLAAMTAADLALAADLASDPELPPLTRPFAELLRDALKARLGDEVALGTQPPAVLSGSDDIGLAGGEM